jgi:hypothetical protein
MSNVHKTARGATIDMNKLKLQNERVIAVGNSGQNARGDEVRGSRIVKTREQIMQEHYAIRGDNIARESKNKNNRTELEPDMLPNEDQRKVD